VALDRQRRVRQPRARIAGSGAAHPAAGIALRRPCGPRDERRVHKEVCAAGDATHTLVASTHAKRARHAVGGRRAPRARCRQAGQAVAEL